MFKVPSTITVTVENTMFRIFITDDTVTCFQCHQTGHFSIQYKNIPDIVHTNIDECLDSSQDLFSSHPEFSLTLVDLKMSSKEQKITPISKMYGSNT